jgi:hypothetical protein
VGSSQSASASCATAINPAYTSEARLTTVKTSRTVASSKRLPGWASLGRASVRGHGMIRAPLKIHGVDASIHSIACEKL